MKVLLDAHILGEREGGNETYIAGLIEGFSQLQFNKSLQVTVLHSPHYQPKFTLKEHLQYQSLKGNNNWKRLFFTIPTICHQNQIELVHVTYNASPFMTLPVVVTVHDVIFRIYPKFFSPRVRILLSTLMPLTMRKAKSIITVSAASKKDIEHFYPFTRGKIYVTPEAPGPLVKAIPDYITCNKITRSQDFILSVGTIQPRKNIARLIEAYIALRQKGSTNARLVIVGRDDWQNSHVHRVAKESGFAEDIVFTGYIQDQVLSALYRKCSVFVYPSLYEGFGLPVIEAMACGAPVITSNTSSLPEVAGDAALKVDPYSTSEIAQAIEAVLNNNSLREELRQKGENHAQNFRWEKTALDTYHIYKETILRNNKAK